MSNRPIGPGRQIDPGIYNLEQSGTQVGTCYVVEGAELDTTVEHWCLYPSFESPHLSSGSSVKNLVVRCVTAPQLTPRSTTIRSSGVAGLGDFFAIMRDHASYNNLAIQYVRSDCTLFDEVPQSP